MKPRTLISLALAPLLLAGVLAAPMSASADSKAVIVVSATTDARSSISWYAGSDSVKKLKATGSWKATKKGDAADLYWAGVTVKAGRTAKKVSCTITLNGKVVSKDKAKGKGAVATCGFNYGG